MLIILLPSILVTTWHGMVGSSVPISSKALVCFHLCSTNVALEQNIPYSFDLCPLIQCAFLYFQILSMQIFLCFVDILTTTDERSVSNACAAK